MVKEDKKIKKINYYKISTFILIGIIILVLIVLGLNWYGNNQFQKGYFQGEQYVFQGIIENINGEGYVTFGQDNSTVTLIPYEMLQTQKEQTILEIMNKIETEGYVQLYNNETEVILVPYSPTSVEE